MKNLSIFVKNEIEDSRKLMTTIPLGVAVFFVISVVVMNLLANKEIYTGVSWLALDCGLLLSWLSFLCMDMLTKRFGPKVSIKMSMFAILINLFVAAVLKVASIIPGNWGEFYTFGEGIINQSLNNTIGGTWYVLLGSTIAFTVSSIVNSFLNYEIGIRIKKKNFKEYAMRSYISTLFGQFVDNFIFAIIVSHNFFGWSMLQCITCSITGCIVELLCEVVFSPVGYKVCKQWEKDKVGEEYIKSRKENI